MKKESHVTGRLPMWLAASLSGLPVGSLPEAESRCEYAQWKYGACEGTPLEMPNAWCLRASFCNGARWSTWKHADLVQVKTPALLCPPLSCLFLGLSCPQLSTPKKWNVRLKSKPEFRGCTRAEEHSMQPLSPSMVHAHAQFAERTTINIQSRVPSAWAMWTSFRNRTRWCTCIETSDCGPLPVAESPKTG